MLKLPRERVHEVKQGMCSPKSATRGSMSVRLMNIKEKLWKPIKNVPFHTQVMTIVCPPTSKSDEFKD